MKPLDDREQRRLTAAASAFAGGFIAGATLALLLAPASGGDTRRWIRTQGGSARHRASDFLHRRQQALAIVRRHGVLGLVRRRREPPREA